MNETHSYRQIEQPAVRSDDRRLPAPIDDEIDLIEIVKVIWRGKFLIMLSTAVFVIVAAYHALNAKPQYSVSVLLAPASVYNKGISSSLGQFSSLGAALGLPLQGKSLMSESVARLNSRQFIERFIEKYEIRKYLFSGLWDDEREVWLEPQSTPLSEAKAYVKALLFPSNSDDETLLTRDYREGPTYEQAYKAFKSILSVNENSKTSLVTVSILYGEPYLAASWANAMVYELNLEERSRALVRTEEMITSLRAKLEQTPLREVRISISNLIEEQFKLLTLAQTQEAYSFRVIDPAFPSQIPTKPNRPRMVIIAALIGFSVGLFVVLVIRLWKQHSGKAQ